MDLKKGLTLVELLVVIAIVGLILGLGVASFNLARNKARDAVIVTELQQLQGIAETVYHPEIGYRDFYEMRGSPPDFSGDHSNIAIIRKRISEMGRNFNFNFLEDSLDFDGYDYCAYVRLFANEDEVYCVDYRGMERIIEISPGDTKINCQQPDSRYADCDNIN